MITKERLRQDPGLWLGEARAGRIPRLRRNESTRALDAQGRNKGRFSEPLGTCRRSRRAARPVDPDPISFLSARSSTRWHPAGRPSTGPRRCRHSPRSSRISPEPLASVAPNVPTNLLCGWWNVVSPRTPEDRYGSTEGFLARDLASNLRDHASGVSSRISALPTPRPFRPSRRLFLALAAGAILGRPSCSGWARFDRDATARFRPSRRDSSRTGAGIDGSPLRSGWADHRLFGGLGWKTE